MPAPAPVSAPLPLTVIAGYLGAGKTTLVNRLLAEARGRRLMVLVNDFGDIAIDAALIAARDGDTISLSNGCVCCSIGADLFRAFSRALDRRPRPDHLVIEASGVAEPRRIADLARAEPELALDAVVTLVDALNGADHLGDPLIGRAVEAQIAAADLLALTKTDLAGADAARELEARLAAINPGAPVLRAARGRLPLDVILGRAPAPAPGPAAAPADAERRADAPAAPRHEDVYRRWSLTDADAAPDAETLRALLDSLPEGIVRLKGISSAQGEAVMRVFQIAGRQRRVETVARPEGVPPGLQVVAIGLADRLPVPALEAAFAALARRPGRAR